MLEEIRIKALGVIEESVLELGPGFTAVTGETGAGKTMVVTALGLLMGGRADPGRSARDRRAPSSRAWWTAERSTPCPASSRRPAASSRTAGCCWPARSRRKDARAPSPEVPVSRRPCWASSPSPWSPCTASPTSTGCCGPRPSAALSTASPARSGRAARPLRRRARRPPGGRDGAGRGRRHGSRARTRGRPAALRARGDREGGPPARGGRRPGGRGVAPRVRRLAAAGRRAGPCRAVLRRLRRPRRPGGGGHRPTSAGRRARARPRGGRPGRPVGRAELRAVRPRRRRGVVRHRARDRSRAAGRGLGPARGAGRPHPQVRRHRRRGAVLGPDLSRPTGRPRRHRRPDRRAAGPLHRDPRRAGEHRGRPVA